MLYRHSHLVLGTIAAAIQITGCDAPQPAVITDPTTGCQYLQTSSHGGITPRLDAAGKQLCVTQEKP
jgi:hypothetical protein